MFIWCNQQAGPDESLKDVALRILHNKISAVPILSSSEDGSCPNLLFIACLSGILKREISLHLMSSTQLILLSAVDVNH